MRAVSLTMRRSMYARETKEVALVLITVTHPLLSTPVRVSSDPTARLSEQPLRYGTVSRGSTYTFVPMSVMLPDDIEERAPTSQIQIENVSRDLVALLRSMRSPADVRMEVVLASTPDAVEYLCPKFQLKHTRGAAPMLTLELHIDSLVEEPFPSGSFSPSYFPGLF